ncbi:hypothetical protein ARMA_0935 [Ardenticatena maritima]|uniref:Uncharacterized protein n=1 Tax=Ardenticatena maritima TaxID=872965 RepID=A0A0M8K619_9CHLR|nr:hypothetical protein ARMA_0935 [Ardenticatena maritima]
MPVLISTRQAFNKACVDSRNGSRLLTVHLLATFFQRCVLLAIVSQA